MMSNEIVFPISSAMFRASNVASHESFEIAPVIPEAWKTAASFRISRQLNIPGFSSKKAELARSYTTFDERMPADSS